MTEKPIRIVFEARAWNAELLSAVQAQWNEQGIVAECIYVTHHREAARVLQAAGRTVTEIPAAVRRLGTASATTDLERIEEKYGDTLLPLPRYLLSERYFTGRDRDWQLGQLASHARFFDELFERFKPHLYIGDLPDIMPLWLAMDMAPWHGCEPVGVGASSFPPGRLLLTRGHREIAGARSAYETMRARGISESELAAARSLQAIVRGEGTVVDYRPPARTLQDLSRRLVRGEVIREHVRLSTENLRERRAGTWFLQPDPILFRLRGGGRVARSKLADARFLTEEIPGRPYAFYPLHMEPEAALLVHGSYFEDQIQVVRNIARSLPVGWELAVKEHPVMRGMRPLPFYRALASIPSVRLLPFEIPTNQVALGSKLVAVVSGTVGLESSAVGKPVLMFGEFPWDYAPNVHRVGRLTELPDLIRTAAASDLGPDHPDVLAFVASWDASLPKGRFFKHRGYDWLEPDNVRRIADAFLTKAPVAQPAG